MRDDTHNADALFENMRRAADGLATVQTADELAKTMNRLSVAATMPECPSAKELTEMDPAERWRMVLTVYNVASYLQIDVAFLLAILTGARPELVREALGIANTDLDAVTRAVAAGDVLDRVAASDRLGRRISKADSN